jgi:hypothetical protein
MMVVGWHKMSVARIGVIAGVLAVLVTGCGIGSAGNEGASEEPGARSSPSASTTEKPMLTDPAEVLALADLELPADAIDAVVTHKTFPDTYRTKPDYAYTVTFTASRKSLDAIAQEVAQVSVDELAPTPAGSPNHRLEMSSTVTEVTPESRIGDGSFDPGNGGYGGIIVLFDGPELTTAHVVVTSSLT